MRPNPYQSNRSTDDGKKKRKLEIVLDYDVA